MLPTVIQQNRSMHLMQDGATAHTAQTRMELLQHQRVPVLPSSGLNQIEKVGSLSGKVMQNCPKPFGIELSYRIKSKEKDA